jgi:CRP-like cAMP-binding protein
VLLTEGDYSDDLFIIISGKVGLYKINEKDLKPHLIAEVNCYDSLGEMRLLKEDVCSLTAKANGTTEVIKLSIAQLRLDENFELYKALIFSTSHIMRDRLISVNESVAYALYKNKRKTKQLWLSILLGATLAFFLIEVGFGLYYILNAHDLCNTISNGISGQKSPF